MIDVEARAIRRASHDILHGTATLTTIRRRWNRAGLLAHHSTVTVDGWSVAGVRLLLINPRLAGLSVHHGQVVGKGTWQPIIRVRTHQRLVVRLVDERQHVRRPHGSPPVSLLEGLGFCQLCGSPLVTTVGREGRAVYRCGRHHSQIGRIEADGHVLAELARAWGMESTAPFKEAALDDLRDMLGKTLTIAVRPGRARDLTQRIVITRTGSRSGAAMTG